VELNVFRTNVRFALKFRLNWRYHHRNRAFVRIEGNRPMSITEADGSGDALAAVVRARRRQLRLRQDELADLAGVSERFVYALEHGKKSVQLDKTVAVLAALGLHLELQRGGAWQIEADAVLRGR
jgi:y4mF family transcriptional regulator